MPCPKCKATLYRKVVQEAFNVCPECGHHMPLSGRERVRQLLDEDSFEEWLTEIMPCDPLGFVDRIPYVKRLEAEQKKTGMTDAAMVGKGFIRGRPVVLCITDFQFMAGSMGSVVGEKLTRAIEEATKLRLPLIIVSGSGGGARTIWNTVRIELPEGFQTSEFLLEHGFVDRIVHRHDLRTELARLVDYCEKT